MEGAPGSRVIRREKVVPIDEHPPRMDLMGGSTLRKPSSAT